MGIYVDIYSNKGKQIASGKYGVGFAILMFSRYKETKTKFVFEATGAEAIANLDKYIKYVQSNMTAENEDALTKIENKLYEIRSKVKENESYVLDYSEMMGCVNNPNYDPMRFVTEMVDKIDDAIHGYQRFGMQDTVATQMMKTYLSSLYPEFNVSSVVKETKHQFIFTVTIYETDEDKKYLQSVVHNNPDEDDWQKKLFDTLKNADFANLEFEDFKNHLRTAMPYGDDWQAAEYYQRKMFMILKNAKLEFEYMKADTKNSAYVIMDKDFVYKLVDSKPFVVCSAKWNTTYPMYYLVPNTPEAKEKFYIYHTAQISNNRKLESLAIDDIDVLSLAPNVLEAYIGKELTLSACSYADLDAYHL